jgi:restriction system protein
MRETILEYVGTPQENRDWSQPGEWIPEVLVGEERDLATRLWERSEGKVNPRHTLGSWLMCSSYGLCEVDSDDVLHITELGQDFLQYERGKAVRRVDYSEGMLTLLAIVSEHGPGKRSDLLPHFTEFMLANSQVRSPAAISERWYARIVNLVGRKLIRRDGVTYTIESTGLDYLEQVGNLAQYRGQIAPQPVNDLRKLLEKQSVEVHTNMLDALRNIDPFQLEHVVRNLLEAMGYENVEVTKRSNDGGVDVVGDITIGITYVREVVQVKRHQSNIQRKILHELRGVLHRFKAYRGTVITTGKFSGGAKHAAFEQGAAPITLIDGERLVELLIEHEIGAQKETFSVLRFRPQDFKPDEAEIENQNNP